MKTLHCKFSLENGFKNVEPQDEEMYYFVCGKYIFKLLNWLRGNIGAESLFVYNSPMFEDSSVTKVKNASQNIKSHILEERVWRQLVTWFGGGPELAIPALRNEKTGKVTIDRRGKTIRVVCHNDKTRYRRFFLSSSDVMATMKEKICDVFNLDPIQCRMHDYYQYRPFIRLDYPKDLDATLTQKHILHENLIFMELPDEYDKFRIEYLPRGGFGVRLPTAAIPKKSANEEESQDI